MQIKPKGMVPFDAQSGGEVMLQTFTIGIQAWARILLTAEQGREQYFRPLFPNRNGIFFCLGFARVQYHIRDTYPFGME